MMEMKLHELYTQITQKIHEMIPEEWDSVIVYSEIFNESSNVSFYYYPITKSEPIYYTQIWDELGVDYHEFNQLHRELSSYFKQLRRTFIDHGQEPWTNLTMRFDSNGKFSIEYHYDDFTDIDAYTRLMLWKHMIAQVPLQDSCDVNTVNEYIDYLQKRNWLYNNRPVQRVEP
jgi:uncharacterized protein (TIGR01741 family)